MASNDDNFVNSHLTSQSETLNTAFSCADEGCNFTLPALISPLTVESETLNCPAYSLKIIWVVVESCPELV